MMRSAFISCFSLCALTAALLASSAIASTVNSSDVQLNITYSFAGAVFTDTGQPADEGIDYEFDGPPSHFYDFVHTFVFTRGNGSGSQTGVATLGSETHTYPDDPNQFESFDPFSDSVTLDLTTMGESSDPNSNGSAGIGSGLSFFIFNYTEDDDEFLPLSLTFTFDYSYTFSMDLVEDAPAGGQGNGFIEIDAELIEDSTTEYPDLVQEFFAGPANIVNQPGAGQIQFVTTPEQDSAELFILTTVNSTTIVPPIPEPTSAMLTLVGLVALGRRR